MTLASMPTVIMTTSELLIELGDVGHALDDCRHNGYGDAPALLARRREVRSELERRHDDRQA